MEKVSNVVEEWSEDDVKYMQEALDEAKLALDEGEVPVGCVFVDRKTRKIIARGHNKVNVTCNPTRHAEFEALDTLNFPEENRHITIYVTCEPCCMCAAALRYANVIDVVYGCANERFGGCGTITPSGTMPLFLPCLDKTRGVSPVPVLKVQAGLFADQAILLLQQFYKQDNMMAPPEKRKRKQ